MKKIILVAISFLVVSAKANDLLLETPNQQQFEKAYVLHTSDDVIAEAQNFEESFSIFTKPFSDDITIRLNTLMDSEVKVSLTDEIGKRILHSFFEGRSTVKTLNTSQLPQGTYFIKIESGKNSFVTKVVKP